MLSPNAEQPRSCLYGDGLFETIAYRDGELRYWHHHWARLQMGLQRLHYPTVTETHVLAVLQSELVELSNDAVVRLSVSRSGVRGYRAFPDATVLIEVQTFPFPTTRWHGRGIRARWCTTTWAQQPLLAGIKHLNRLEQVLARSEWTDVDIEEGLVCDTVGAVISGTMSAVLVRHGRIVLAADLSQTGIDSVARRVVMDALPALGYALKVQALSRHDVLLADEVLLMNSVQGVGFVAECEGYQGKSTQLMEQLVELFSSC
jgi:4-amino-4-deoxychorismate lyase